MLLRKSYTNFSVEVCEFIVEISRLRAAREQAVDRLVPSRIVGVPKRTTSAEAGVALPQEAA